MLNFPSAFPSDAISTGLGIIRNGELTAKQRTFGECVWNVAGYGGNLVLADGPSAMSVPSLSDEEKQDLTDFVDACNALSTGVHAQKIGDGKLLENLKNWLPLLLQLLPLFGVKLPGT